MIPLIAILLLSGCSMMTKESDIAYQPTSQQSPIYHLQKWQIDGRIALNSKEENWQANLEWTHQPQNDLLKLSGPLGQGGAIIKLTPYNVSIDQGGNDVQSSNEPEKFIAQQLGLSVPVHALSHWIVGLPEPSEENQQTEKGFSQLNWQIYYKSMKPVKEYLLPQSLIVSNSQVKLKIFIDQWTLDDK